MTVLPATPTWAASRTCFPSADSVGDLDQVVDLGACADAGFADGRPIHRRIRADLDVVFDDQPADLRDLFVAAVAAVREAEAVGAEHDPVLEHDAAADLNPLADGDLGVETQSSPISAKRPIVTWGCTMVRAPIRAPSATTAKAPMLASGAMAAPGSTCASGWTPPGGRHPSANSAIARANIRYRSSARRTAQGTSVTAGAAITADARVPRSSSRYLRFAKNVRSPEPAFSSAATLVTSMSPSPSSGAREPRGNVAQLHVDTALRSKKLTRCSSLNVSWTACTRGSRTPGATASSRRSSLSGALGS